MLTERSQSTLVSRFVGLTALSAPERSQGRAKVADALDAAETENAVENGQPPATYSEAQDRQESFSNAVSQLRSMLADVKQSLASAGLTTLPDTSALANSSNETGNTQPS